MSEEGGGIQTVDWRRSCTFLEILRSFRMAIHPANLLRCFLGLVVSFALAVAVDEAFETNVDGASLLQHVHRIATTTLWGEWALPYVGGKTSDDFLTFLMAPAAAAREAGELAAAYWQEEPGAAVIITLLSLAVWAVAGGAVTRMAAVRVAREESVPLKSALGFSLRKWPSTVTSPLIPFGVLVFMAIIMGALTGLPGMIPYVGEFYMGIFLGLSLLMGVVLALIFIGGAFSVGLQWPTIAAEGSDSFDAISRSISYISSRPWRYLFLTVFSVLYGCATFILVKFLSFLTLRLTHEAVSTFTMGVGGAEDKLLRLWSLPELAAPWPEMGALEAPEYAEGAAAYLFAFWVWVVLGVMMAFLASFFFCSQTVIYFLLRKGVDATDIEEVYMEESEEEELPVEQPAEDADAGETGPESEDESPPAEPPAEEDAADDGGEAEQEEEKGDE